MHICTFPPILFPRFTRSPLPELISTRSFAIAIVQCTPNYGRLVFLSFLSLCFLPLSFLLFFLPSFFFLLGLFVLVCSDMIMHPAPAESRFSIARLRLISHSPLPAVGFLTLAHAPNVKRVHYSSFRPVINGVGRLRAFRARRQIGKQ